MLSFLAFEYKRCHHAITENIRVNDAIEALKCHDDEKLGKLLTLSHKSLKEDYEVTGVELDTIVDALVKSEVVLGARMTGAGFGGCAIALIKDVDEKQIDELFKDIKKNPRNYKDNKIDAYNILATEEAVTYDEVIAVMNEHVNGENLLLLISDSYSENYNDNGLRHLTVNGKLK